MNLAQIFAAAPKGYVDTDKELTETAQKQFNLDEGKRLSPLRDELLKSQIAKNGRSGRGRGQQDTGAADNLVLQSLLQSLNGAPNSAPPLPGAPQAPAGPGFPGVPTAQVTPQGGGPNGDIPTAMTNAVPQGGTPQGMGAIPGMGAMASPPIPQAPQMPPAPAPARPTPQNPMDIYKSILTAPIPAQQKMMALHQLQKFMSVQGNLDYKQGGLEARNRGLDLREEEGESRNSRFHDGQAGQDRRLDTREQGQDRRFSQGQQGQNDRAFFRAETSPDATPAQVQSAEKNFNDRRAAASKAFSDQDRAYLSSKSKEWRGNPNVIGTKVKLPSGKSVTITKDGFETE